MVDSIKIWSSEFVKAVGLFDALKESMKTIAAIFSGTNQPFNDFLNKAKELALQVRDFLLPSFQQLWATLSNQVFPVLQRLWKEVLEPLAPYIGGALVIALKLGIEQLNLMITVWSRLANTILAVIKFIVGFGDKTFEIFGRIPNFISTAFNNLTEIISAPFKKAFEVIKKGAEDVIAVFDKVKKAVTGAPSNIAGGVGSLISKINPFDKRAMGGSVTAGQPYIVGERGQELFVPSQSGTIVPNHQLGGGSVNITIAPNIGVYAGSAIERRKLAMQILNDLRDVANQQNTGLSSLLGANNPIGV
jgi:hypothetical protein